MKRYLKYVLLFLMVLSLSGISAAAEEAQFKTEWYGDYATMELVIKVQPSAKYIQQITAVLYPAAVSNPSFGDYSRVKEVKVSGSETEIRFKLTDNLSAPDGAYKIKIQGNGYLSGESLSEQEVWILRPSDADPNAEGSLLKEINNASADSVNGYMVRLAKALRINVSEQESSVKLQAFINIRSNDYNGAFKTVNEAADAWKIAEVVEYLTEADAEPSKLGVMIEDISSVLNIKTDDEDYTACKDKIYENIIKLKSNGEKFNNCAELKKIFNRAKALAVINAANESNIEQKLSLYYKDLEIEDSVYNQFRALTETDRQKVSRQLLGKSFSSVQTAKSAFNEAVAEFAASDNTGGGNGAGSGGSGGGRGNGATVAPGGVSMPTGQNNNSGSSEFSDVNESFWAYRYITELKKEGIISGYEDAKFYPDRPVTREEFVKMIVGATGTYEGGRECSFKDADSGEWYYPYISSAVNCGIIKGISDEMFGIGQEVKREDAAVIMFRAVNSFKNINTDNIGDTNFSDSSDISDYAKESVNALSGLSLINGFEDGSFRPQISLSRAEAAKILYELRKYIQQ